TFLSKVEGFPVVDDGGQGGMLDVALDPAFESNRMIYWSFSEPYGNGNLTSVAKGRLSADEQSIEDPTVIYRAEPSYNGSLHYGSRLAFDDAGDRKSTRLNSSHVKISYAVFCLKKKKKKKNI